MNDTNRILNAGGGLVAALLCLLLTACGPANPDRDSGNPTPDAYMGDGGMDLPDSYVPPDTDGGMPDLDSGPIEVDASVYPDCTTVGSSDECATHATCVAFPEGAGGHCVTWCLSQTDCSSGEICAATPSSLMACLPSQPVAACTPEYVASRWPGCGALYDLPVGMTYDDTAMIPACATTLNGTRWQTTGGNTCDVIIGREPETDQWIMNFGCPNAIDLPHGGIYRLGSDGSWHANEGNAALPGVRGNHGRLVPSSDCLSLTGEFFRGGESTRYWTQNYWMM